MKNYWYIARENELLLDCDKGFNRKDAEHILRIVQREGCTRRLRINTIEPSSTPGHFHVSIFVYDLNEGEKMALAVMLGSDRHREILAHFQLLKNWTNPYLVVSNREWLNRLPDNVCFHRNWRKCSCLRKIQHPPISIIYERTKIRQHRIVTL